MNMIMSFIILIVIIKALQFIVLELFSELFRL